MPRRGGAPVGDLAAAPDVGKSALQGAAHGVCDFAERPDTRRFGGFGSLPGAIVGGLVIGVVESLAGMYLPEGFKDVAAYVVVLAMLMVKPTGLFGESERKKV